MRWRNWAGTSISAIPASASAITSTAIMKVKPTLASAGRISLADRPISERDWLISSQMPIDPSTSTLATDLPSSTRPCVPKMRLSPDSGLSFDPLKPSAAGRKPSEPSIAGAPIAAAMVIANRANSGRTTAPARRQITAPGSKSRRSAALNDRPSVSMFCSAVTVIGPRKAIHSAPPRTTSAVPSSRD